MNNLSLALFVAPLFGLLGIALGIILNESIRRANRREIFASKVFEKRLAKYEELFDLVANGSEVANEILGEDSLSPAQRHSMISSVILEIAHFQDKNRLYVNSDLAAHCTALFMGVEDIPAAEPEERKRLTRAHYESVAETFRMISEDAGVAVVNRLFRAINRAKIDSPVISHINKLRREASKKK